MAHKFAVTSKEECEQAIKSGGIAVLVSLAITLIFSVIGFYYQGSDQTLNYLFDPWMLIDVVLMSVFAFFIFKKSRVAATCMFVYFIAGKLMMWSDLGEVNGLPMTILFLFFFGRAMYASFVLHSKFNEQGSMQEVSTEI